MKKILLLMMMLVAVCAFKCGGDGGGGKSLPVKMPTAFNYSYPTPFGAMIYSVVPIPDAQKAGVFSSVEIGINRQIETSSRHNPTWTQARSLSDYRVAFIEPDAINGDGSPALMYRGQIQTAGTVLGVDDDGYSPPIIVLPHQANQNWMYTIYLRESARNESEHFAEWFNDESIFYQFATANDVHPHWKADGE